MNNTEKINMSEYAAKSIIDREYFEALPIHEKYAYVLSCVVGEIDEAVQSGALMYHSSSNPLVKILQQAKAESGITITLQIAMRQYKKLTLERVSA